GGGGGGGRGGVEEERPADALSVEVAPLDPEVVEQGDVVGGVGAPAVLGGDGGVGLAAGVPLVHGDHPERRGELGDGVHRGRGAAPHIDDRLQAGGGEGEDGESLAVLLVVDRGPVVLKARHVG